MNAPTAVVTAAVSATTVGAALRHSREQLADKQVPLAGLAAAFVFAAQMFNFPVVGGTTGHLLGGALAAVLLGPWIGAIVVSVVVFVQALAFADGGLTALGYNVLNMAVVTAFGGWAVFRLLRRLLPRNTTGVTVAAGVAATVSVVLSAMAFSVEWLFGATAPVPFDTVLAAMVGVHALIGVGEGLITGLTVGAVLAVRPDLVEGARDLSPAAAGARVRGKPLVLSGVGVALLVAAGVSQFAAPAPDGLERVAIDQGFADRAQDHPLASSLFADYATAGVADETLSLAIAGMVGVVLTLAVGTGVFLALRDRRRAGVPPRTPA